LKKLEHLSEIYRDYDTFVIDLWGVMHNGISLNNKAIEVVDNLLKDSKKIVFLSNAPRPSEKVRKFLQKLKMEEKYLKNIITSGEAAMNEINNNRFGKLFYHLGPLRDESIFYKIRDNKTKLENSDFILCTGLFDGHENDLNFYKNFLKNCISKKLICTNPDLTVHRGEKEEYCAGSIAKIFESLGGSVVYFGKPYKEIYKMCFNSKEKVLAIGDNLRTDIKGANNLNIDSIFISDGVHRDEFKNQNELQELLKKYKVDANYFQPEFTW
jgi:HAD superfamily hydrolase (TIGR01459 family)|tara:strand:- start:778 stop:1584 length:807 start_codon:yes stop_codon:yes gene_type:complete